jgi:hypothetical protein
MDAVFATNAERSYRVWPGIRAAPRPLNPEKE